MNKTLGQHISHLEERLAALNHNFMEKARTLAERNRLESEIRAAELALDHYRKAFDFEQRLS